LEGLAIAEGVRVSSGNGTPSLIVGCDGAVNIATTGPDDNYSNVTTAVSGESLVLNNGVPTTRHADIQPRTALGLSRNGRYVFF
jgi:hypothetical protein